jgi:hypothetical protein
LSTPRFTACSDPADGAAFAAAVTGLRQHSTPYYLAHGLLDHAQHLSHLGDDQAAAAAIGEAAIIAQQLRCQTLLDRAETIQPARPAPRPRDDRICPPRPARCRGTRPLIHAHNDHSGAAQMSGPAIRLPTISAAMRASADQR